MRTTIIYKHSPRHKLLNSIYTMEELHLLEILLHLIGSKTKHGYIISQAKV